MSSGWPKTDGREEHMWQLTNEASPQLRKEEWSARVGQRPTCSGVVVQAFHHDCLWNCRACRERTSEDLRGSRWTG
jgi:hypothetical protein